MLVILIPIEVAEVAEVVVVVPALLLLYMSYPPKVPTPWAQLADIKSHDMAVIFITFEFQIYLHL